MKNILDLLIVGLYRIIAYPSIVINRWVLRGHYYGEVDVLSGFVFWTLCYQLVWGEMSAWAAILLALVGMFPSITWHLKPLYFRYTVAQLRRSDPGRHE